MPKHLLPREYKNLRRFNKSSYPWKHGFSLLQCELGAVCQKNQQWKASKFGVRCKTRKRWIVEPNMSVDPTIKAGDDDELSLLIFKLSNYGDSKPKW